MARRFCTSDNETLCHTYTTKRECLDYNRMISAEEKPKPNSSLPWLRVTSQWCAQAYPFRYLLSYVCPSCDCSCV